MTLYKSDFVQLASGFPLLLVLFTFILTIILKDFQTVMFLILLFVSVWIYRLLKNIFEFLMGNKTWPILGKGTRPFPKVADCSLGGFKFICKSYGMPSGHVLYATIFSSYWIARLINSDHKILLIVLLSSISLFVMYSRVVWAKAHTWQHVVVGAIFGSLIGWHYYGFVENIKSKYVGNL